MKIIIVIVISVAPASSKSAREGRGIGWSRECDEMAGTLINYSPLGRTNQQEKTEAEKMTKCGFIKNHQYILMTKYTIIWF